MAYAAYWMWLQSNQATVYGKTSPATGEILSANRSRSLYAVSGPAYTLPVGQPDPVSSTTEHGDIVEDFSIKAERAVRLGEREDTLPPHYRFPKD